METPDTLEQIKQLKQRVAESIVGQEHVIDSLLIAILTNGNVLMEGLPGLAKTRAIKTLSRCVESEFRRVQFTPDLLPADVTGSEVPPKEEVLRFGALLDSGDKIVDGSRIGSVHIHFRARAFPQDTRC